MRDKNGENVNQSGTRRESALNPTRQHSLEWREVLTACCNFYSKLKLLGMLKKLRLSLECVAGFPMTLCQEVQLLSNSLLSNGLYVLGTFSHYTKIQKPSFKNIMLLTGPQYADSDLLKVRFKYLTSKSWKCLSRYKISLMSSGTSTKLTKLQSSNKRKGAENQIGKNF